MAKKTKKDIKVITYGTFDMFHKGHQALLERAKKLGNYLIVGVTGSEYDKNRGKLNVSQSLHQRIKNIEKTGLADEIIIEEYDGQKVIDIQKYNVDLFIIGSDWKKKFDYLEEYCKVKYLPRTKGISSTSIRNNSSFIKLGIIGYGNIARRFVQESKFVSNTEVTCVYGKKIESVEKFIKTNEIKSAFDDFDDFIGAINAVYIATPHNFHFEYAKKCLNAGKHVLCEKPLCLKKNQTKELIDIAKKKNLVLMEAVKTAFCDGFNQMVSLAKSGIIGDIIHLDASFTKLIPKSNIREYNRELAGGAHNELMTYPLLVASKILGQNVIDYKNLRYFKDSKVDIFSKLELIYPKSTANLYVGIGVKKEGDLIISGTKGYIYCPAPWWKTTKFEIKFENNKNINHEHSYLGDGLRYEIAEFANCINFKNNFSFKLNEKDMIFLSKFIESDYQTIRI
jgi:choline-phosphate cytidylyltransferase